MHSGSRFDRPSTPARPFTGAPDKLAERRWGGGEKRINQEGEENESVFWITDFATINCLENFKFFPPSNLLTRKIYWIKEDIKSLSRKVYLCIV